MSDLIVRINLTPPPSLVCVLPEGGPFEGQVVFTTLFLL